MTTFADIFKDANIRSSLTQFTDAHLDRLETSLFEKNGKPALTCMATGKDKLAKPEEIVRQLWLLELTETYNYPINRIQIEYLAKKAEITGEENKPWLVDACYYDICIREGLPVDNFKRGGSRLLRLFAQFR